MSFISKTATILNGAAISDALTLEGKLPSNMVMPAAFAATAKIAFSISFDGTTYYPLRNIDGTVYEIVFTASTAYALNRDLFRGVGWIKVRSALAGTGVNQDADRAIIISVAD